MDLAAILTALEADCSDPEFLASDPVEIPRQATSKRDLEYQAMLCALFAYGNVKSMKRFLRELLNGGENLYYRFQSVRDIEAARNAVAKLLEREGTFEVFFPANQSLEQSFPVLQSELLGAARGTSRGLVHLFGDPRSGSARKRLCMFLRWMTRKKFPDFGVYSLPPSRLVVPLDTHMIRMASNLGLLEIKSPSFRAALQLTEAFRAIDPEDPVRFDFALTRPGITGICKSRFLETCRSCALRDGCRIFQKEWSAPGRPG